MIELAETAFLDRVADIEIGFGTNEIVDGDRDGVRCSARSRKRDAERGNETQAMQREFHVGPPNRHGREHCSKAILASTLAAGHRAFPADLIGFSRISCPPCRSPGSASSWMV